MPILVYGIITCSTCKKALQWLKTNNIDHTWIDSRSTPPSKEDISSWVESLGNKAMRNTSGGSYRALSDVAKTTWTDAQWIDAFTADPMLLKRPLFVRNGTAVAVGFTENDPNFVAKLRAN